ncbi:stimulator of interferon genes protein [Gouania willdenowi]|uniref:Stimulator of interferon genes protein n=1 Tax=Gouania willdenowi TaxID=441366 RepID=A0A8C5I5C3_GOUWI|nr:stimulator of interferon genes protein [Gouania willdenowi]
MQHLRDQEKLIPRPRGTLPKILAAALALTAAVGAVIWSPEKFFGQVTMTILIHTFGPLLHGICLLAEEMLHHSNTRYHGKTPLKHMLSACGLGGRTMLTAALTALLLSLVHDQLSDKYQYWELLPLVFMCYPLLRSLGVLRPSEVEISDICEGRKMNVAHGLAWSFYLGYLRLVLPRLDDNITTFCAQDKNNSSFLSRGSRKLLILVPLNANTSHKFEDEDNNISFYGNLPKVEINRAGVRQRVFKHSVYKVKDEHNRVHLCVMENATPLLTLYGMSQESYAGFGEAERRHQVKLFYRTLQEILDHSLECRNRYKLILLNDKDGNDPHFLSKAILQHLEQQEKEEYCVTPLPKQEMVRPIFALPTAPPLIGEQQQQQLELLSTEPTLMFSLEKPHSLKEAVENTDDYYRHRNMQ